MNGPLEVYLRLASFCFVAALLIIICTEYYALHQSSGFIQIELIKSNYLSTMSSLSCLLSIMWFVMLASLSLTRARPTSDDLFFGSDLLKELSSPSAIFQQGLDDDIIGDQLQPPVDSSFFDESPLSLLNDDQYLNILTDADSGILADSGSITAAETYTTSDLGNDVNSNVAPIDPLPVDPTRQQNSKDVCPTNQSPTCCKFTPACVLTTMCTKSEYILCCGKDPNSYDIICHPIAPSSQKLSATISNF